MAQEQLQLYDSAFVQIVRQFLVRLLVHSPHCVPICHLECCEILHLSVESIFEFINGLSEVLIFVEQVELDIELILNSEL